MPGSDRVVAVIRASIAAHEQAIGSAEQVSEAAALIAASLKTGGKLLTFGNGGSAADAQHMASELVGRFERERRAMAAIALTTDGSILTSVANDYQFERVFARQVEGLARPGDVALGISTSGRSANVLAGFAAARAAGAKTIALTGRDGGPIGEAADVHINVGAQSTPRVQEVHRTLLHVLCELVEDAVSVERSNDA